LVTRTPRGHRHSNIPERAIAGEVAPRFDPGDDYGRPILDPTRLSECRLELINRRHRPGHAAHARGVRSEIDVDHGPIKTARRVVPLTQLGAELSVRTAFRDLQGPDALMTPVVDDNDDDLLALLRGRDQLRRLHE